MEPKTSAGLPKPPWNSSRCVKRPQHPSRVARRSEASDDGQGAEAFFNCLRCCCHKDDFKALSQRTFAMFQCAAPIDLHSCQDTRKSKFQKICVLHSMMVNGRLRGGLKTSWQIGWCVCGRGHLPSISLNFFRKEKRQDIQNYISSGCFCQTHASLKFAGDCGFTMFKTWRPEKSVTRAAKKKWPQSGDVKKGAVWAAFGSVPSF